MTPKTSLIPKFLVLTLLLAAFGLAVSAKVEKAETPTTLEGQYEWTHQKEPGDLKAVFSAAGEEAWDVSFHFTFNGEAHTYKGTAEGSLTEGDLAGEVKNENGRRTFIFKGKVADGSFSGEHAEIRRNGERRTGTLTLSH